MARLKAHGTELARMEDADSRIAIMSDCSILRNLGAGWQTWKRAKAGVVTTEFAAKALAAYQPRPAEFYAYIRALAAACDLAHRAQLDALVGRCPTIRTRCGASSTTPDTSHRWKRCSDAAAHAWRCGWVSREQSA